MAANGTQEPYLGRSPAWPLLKEQENKDRRSITHRFQAAIAESAQGISPRAAHRSGLEPLDSSGSCHRAKAAGLPLTKGSSRRTDWPKSTAMTRPLRSTSIIPASPLLRGSPPLSGASVRSASRLEPLVPFPWHHRSGAHVPYQSPVELRAAYTPDAARAVSGHPPS